MEFLGKSPQQAQLLESSMPVPPSMSSGAAADHGTHGVRTGADVAVKIEAALKLLKQGNERFAVGAPTAATTSTHIAHVKCGQAPHSAILGCADLQVPDAASDALAMLKDGNERFAVGAPTAGKVHQSMRADLHNMGQAPHTALVGCADSRVPLETVFDALPGDLFVLRNAGNTCTHAEGSVLGSLEFCQRCAEHPADLRARAHGLRCHQGCHQGLPGLQEIEIQRGQGLQFSEHSTHGEAQQVCCCGACWVC